MSKRLQVLFEDDELGTIRDQAQRAGVSVSEWVRRALRDASIQGSSGDPVRKLAAVRAAMRHSFPSGDIDGMLSEIERGYQE